MVSFSFDNFMKGLASGTDSGLGGFARAYNAAKDNGAYTQGIQQINDGDWQGGVNTIAQRNPEVAMGLIQTKQQSDDRMALQQAKMQQEAELRNTLTPYQQEMLAIKRQQLAQGGGGTGSIQNIEYLQRMGYTPEQAANMVFSGQNPSVAGLGEKGIKKADEIRGKDFAENEIALNDANFQLGQLKDNFNMTKDMMKKAQIGYGQNVIAGMFDRSVPTALLSPESQKARQWLQSGAFSQTLDQAEKLSGPKSDNDIKFLKGVVAGDITQYTPYQIEGAWERIIKNTEDELAKRQNKSSYYKGGNKEEEVIEMGDL